MGRDELRSEHRPYQTTTRLHRFIQKFRWRPAYHDKKAVQPQNGKQKFMVKAQQAKSLPRLSPSFCATCAVIDVRNILQYSESYEGQIHHASYRSLQAAAQSGCPTCQMLHEAYIDSCTEGSRISINQAVEKQLWYDQFSPSYFRIYAWPISKIRDRSPPGIARLTYSRGNEENNEQVRRNDYTCSVRIVSKSGRHSYVRGRPLDQYPNIDLGLFWIELCSNNHEHCATIEDQEMPTRVLEIGETTEPILRLLETKSARGRYICLSHCWGGSRPLSTYKSTYESYLDNISFDSLSRNFQDAVIVTRQLGFKYLWIDSLCIVQDDPKDRAHEIDHMDDVFQRSALTIAGPDASSPEVGFLHLRQSPQLGNSFPTNNEQGVPSNDLMLQRYVKEPEYDRSALAKRGWVLQEQLLSPRILYFGSEQLYFECKTTDQAELHWPLQARESLRFYRASANHQFEWHGLSSNLYDEWRTIVGLYSKRKLSFYKDKFPALSGLAKRFSQRLHDDYIAGLWRQDLANGLLWFVDHPNPVCVDVPKEVRSQAWPSLESISLTLPVREESKYVAPSWSWASVNAPVIYDHFPIDRRVYNMSLFEIKDIRVTHADSTPFGAITSGELVVQGRIFPITLTGSNRRYCLLNEANDLVAEFFPDQFLAPPIGDSLIVDCILIALFASEPKDSWVWLGLTIETAELGRHDTYRRTGYLFGTPKTQWSVAKCNAQFPWGAHEPQIVTIV